MNKEHFLGSLWGKTNIILIDCCQCNDISQSKTLRSIDHTQLGSGPRGTSQERLHSIGDDSNIIFLMFIYFERDSRGAAEGERKRIPSMIHESGIMT